MPAGIATIAWPDYFVTAKIGIKKRRNSQSYKSWIKNFYITQIFKERILINNIFKDILDKYIIIYLNNTLVYSTKALDNYIKKVYEILKHFNKKNLKLKLEKCWFY